MPERRNLRRDALAAALAGAALLLVVSLATYDGADAVIAPIAPLDSLYRADVAAHPLNERPHNALGSLGATIADFASATLGAGAWYAAISLAALAVVVFRGRRVTTPLVRWLGWLLSLVGLTTLLAASGLFAPGPAIGPGGYLGAAMRGAIEARFTPSAAYVFGASMTLAGWILCAGEGLRLISRLGLIASLAAASRAARLASSRATSPGGGSASSASISEASASPSSRAASRNGKPRISDLETRGPAGAKANRSAPVAAPAPIAKEIDDEDPAGASDAALDEAAEDEAGDGEEQSQEIRVVRKRKGAKAASEKAGEKTSSEKTKASKKKQSEEARESVESELDEAVTADPLEDYELPDIDLLLSGEEVRFEEQEEEVRRKALILEKTFAEFGFTVKVVEIETGPVIAQYEVQLEAGLRLSKITGLADDLAIALRVPSVRIVAPIPGKNTVGIEVPNEQRQVVRLRDVIEEDNGKAQKMRIPLFLGKDVSGNPLTVDLSTLPHLLIAGRTGTGKSVCLNAIISSILMTRRPDEVRLLMIDPKMVELSGYGRLPHLMHPVVTDMRKAEAILAWAVDKMEERYALLARAGVRHISSYNQLGEEELHERLAPEDDAEREAIPIHLPFIVIVADEIADMMMTAGKEVEQHIIRLAQKSRAVGIHLILATQKPTVDVITGLIKSNLPARIAFQVASRTDSRVVLDEMGADKLLGNGDMLFLWPGTSTMLRGQGTYLSDDEIKAIVDCVSTTEQHFVKELVNIRAEKGATADLAQMKKRDELYENAVDIVVREGRGSVSLLQRSLGIGYGRAARLVDFMAEDGFVGEYNGSQAREVLLTVEDWEKMQGIQSDEPTGKGKSSKAKASSTPAKPPTTSAPKPSLRAFDEEEAEEEDTFAEDIADEVEAEPDEAEELEYEEEEANEGDEDLWAEEEEEEEQSV